MAEVTDADRDKASKLWARCRDGSAPVLVHEIAVALAEEREKARAPFLELIDLYRTQRAAEETE